MPRSYTIALNDAHDELVQVLAQKKSLELRIAQLEAVIAQLQALVDSTTPAPMPLFDPTPAPTAASPAVPLWKAIESSLNGWKADFTVPTAIKALALTGRQIESKNRLNIVRNTLLQKEDIFGKHDPKTHGPGHYFVKGFENKEEG